MIRYTNAEPDTYPCGHPTNGGPIVISLLGFDKAIRCKVCALDWPIVERLPDGAVVDESRTSPARPASPMLPGEVNFPGGGGLFVNRGIYAPRPKRWHRLRRLLAREV